MHTRARKHTYNQMWCFWGLHFMIIVCPFQLSHSLETTTTVAAAIIKCTIVTMLGKANNKQAGKQTSHKWSTKWISAQKKCPFHFKLFSRFFSLPQKKVKCGMYGVWWLVNGHIHVYVWAVAVLVRDKKTIAILQSTKQQQAKHCLTDWWNMHTRV